MEASQLKIDPKHLQFKPMRKGERARLRRENIKAYIRSKPAGTPISSSEFTVVTRGSANGALSMIKTMIKKGELTRHYDAKTQSYSYTVLEDVKTTKPKDGLASVTETAVARAIANLPKPDAPQVAPKSLTDYAKEFAWEQNSNDLRKFVEWMDGRELHLRRLMDRADER